MSRPAMTRRRRNISIVLLAAGSVAAVTLLMFSARQLIAPRREQRQKRTRRALSSPNQPHDYGADRQHEASGVGDLVHRRYAIDVPRASFTLHTLMHEIQRQLSELSPAGLATFRKTAGDPDTMRDGDEYEITMLGPWNGCVRVADVRDGQFTLVTLDGHPEAGHITFAVEENPQQPSVICVTIESWARARDRAVLATYDTLAVGRQVQTEVWVTFLQRVAALAGCEEAPEVDIQSEELSE